MNESLSADTPAEPAPVATLYIPRDLAARLAEIGRNVQTQDNRITSDPQFLVQRKVRDYGYDTQWADDREIAWLDVDSCEVTGKEREELEQYWNSVGIEADGYTRTAFQDRWETVQTFFTEHEADRFVAANQHRVKGELRVYVDSAYRNPEWQTIREFLSQISLSDTTLSS